MRIGIDLGGTKIEIICLDKAGNTLLRRRVATPAGDYQATLDTLAQLIHKSETELQQTGSVGIGIPGAISPHSGLVKNANSTCLIGQPLDRDLEQLLRRPVRISNDANCFTVSEASDGAAAGADVVFGVILGTGVGGGITIHGRLLEGPNAIAGEWGHNPMPWPQQDEQLSDCYCGRFGCIETWLSGPGFIRDHQHHGGQGQNGQAIMQQVEAGNEIAVASIERYEQRLARALASVINILDPDVIVLGGGISNIKRLYENVPKLWDQFVFSDHVTTRLVQNMHGDSSGVRGAAWLWPGED
jgi:fructokinase